MNFIKTTFVGGILVVLPLLLLWLALKEIFGLLIGLATPIAAQLPEDFLVGIIDAPILVAVLLLTSTSFLFGLMLRARWLVRAGQMIENAVLGKIPMYGMIKRISASLVSQDAEHFAPALVVAEDGGAEPAYLIEELEDGRAAVLFPWAPAAFAGSVKIVERRTVLRLQCTLDEFSRCLSMLGFGLGGIVARSLAQDAAAGEVADGDTGLVGHAE